MAKKWNKKKEWKQGVFTPRNLSKYRGSTPIVYRSSLELRVMRFFDEKPHVVSWGSETIVIPYIKPTDGKLHRYFTDFNVRMKDGRGVVHKYVIEVKPHKQTIPPTNHGNKKPKTLLYEQLAYAINDAKWEAANEWCNKNGYIFTIFTEIDINKYMK